MASKNNLVGDKIVTESLEYSKKVETQIKGKDWSVVITETELPYFSITGSRPTESMSQTIEKILANAGLINKEALDRLRGVSYDGDVSDDDFPDDDDFDDFDDDDGYELSKLARFEKVVAENLSETSQDVSQVTEDNSVTDDSASDVQEVDKPNATE